MGSSSSSSLSTNTNGFKKEYYIDQADKYFDTLQRKTFNKNKIPNYQEFIIRWEWPPWLLLSGYKADGINVVDAIDRSIEDCFVITREYRFLEEQPAIRSKAVIYYGEENRQKKINGIPVYVEFCFDESGKMTFIEAWSLGTGNAQLGTRDPQGWPMKPYRVSPLITPLMDENTGEVEIGSLTALTVMEHKRYAREVLEATEKWNLSVAKEGLYFYCKTIVEEEIKRRSFEETS